MTPLALLTCAAMFILYFIEIIEVTVENESKMTNDCSKKIVRSRSRESIEKIHYFEDNGRDNR